ncbi:MAG: hypothetical protein K2W95_35920 [Candidatus Obscuribacterales bacterium]|nr:hypothetical protein [Candidatus Obscuribacterales bacterium]
MRAYFVSYTYTRAPSFPRVFQSCVVFLDSEKIESKEQIHSLEYQIKLQLNEQWNITSLTVLFWQRLPASDGVAMVADRV